MGIKIYVTVKSLSRHKGFLAKEVFEVETEVYSALDLLFFLSDTLVDRYNNKEIDADLVRALSQNEVEEMTEYGKVGFGRRMGRGVADKMIAREALAIGHEDGLFKVFINEQEISDLSHPVYLNDGDELLLMRLTMLSSGWIPYLF